MSVGVFAVVISMKKVDDLFSSVVIITPEKTKLHDNYQKQKP